MKQKRYSCHPKVLVFHKLVSHLSFGSTNYSPPRLVRLLRYLQEKEFVFQPLDAVLTQKNSHAVALTFDDGYYHLADALPPLIEKYRLQPVIFLPTYYIGKANRWDYSYLFRATPHLDVRRIRELAEYGVEFGSHGHSHINLCRCDEDTLRRELFHSKKLLEDVLGKPVRYISYPFGRYNQRVLEMVREAGYVRGFTMSFPEEHDDVLATGRYAVYCFDTPHSVLWKFGAGLPNTVEKCKARLTNALSAGTMIYRKLMGADKRESPYGEGT
jgi:peptidoglycan/xylan/chitin deacetylase (PgdA/CDA1 family)